MIKKICRYHIENVFSNIQPPSLYETAEVPKTDF